MAKRVLTRIFLADKMFDYVLLIVLGTLPICLAFIVGANTTVGAYHGYIDKDNMNWLFFPLALPLALRIVRSMWQRILPESSSELPILDPISDPIVRHRAYDLFLRRVLANTTLFTLLAVALFLNIWDYCDAPGKYYYRYWKDPSSVQTLDQQMPSDAKDWTTMFVAHVLPGANVEDPISWEENVALSLVAYGSQFTISVLALSLVVLFALYNLSFLGLVYQHRYEGKQFRPIVVRIQDENRRFGFERASLLFTAEVFVTFVIGLFILVSRISNRGEGQEAALRELGKYAADLANKEWNQEILKTLWNAVVSGLDDLGQVILCIAWTVVFAITLLPMFIKMLPAFPKPWQRPELIGYLREFMPNGSWEKSGYWEWGDCTSDEDVRFVREQVAVRFAKQNFWPNGDRWAVVAIGCASFMGQWMLVPFLPVDGGIAPAILLYMFFAGVAGMISGGIYIGLKRYLRIIGLDSSLGSE